MLDVKFGFSAKFFLIFSANWIYYTFYEFINLLLGPANVFLWIQYFGKINSGEINIGFKTVD
jgi:hypothetical protein